MYVRLNAKRTDAVSSNFSISGSNLQKSWGHILVFREIVDELAGGETSYGWGNFDPKAWGTWTIPHQFSKNYTRLERGLSVGEILDFPEKQV